MDARQLMLGDYVFNTELGKNEIDKVVVIDTTRVLLENGKLYTPINYIEPIPLTEAILEKFGIEEFCWPLFRFHDDKGFEITKDYYGDYYWSIDYSAYRIVRLHYVHELQHVLRLCGIDKEIKLNN